MRLRFAIDPTEVRRKLVTKTAMGRIRDAAPVTVSRPPDMTEEQMLDVSMPCDDVFKCLLLAPSNNIHATHPEWPRRMMQRKIDRATCTFSKDLVCPFQPLTAEPIHGYPRLIGVKKYEPAGRRLDHLLNKTVVINWNRREHFSKLCPIVMIA